MATVVQSIVDNAETLALAVLGAGWKRLRRLYELEKNDGRVSSQGYGCRPLEADTAPTITGTETLDQYFDFTLSDVITRGDDDQEIQNILDSLYDSMDDIFKSFVVNKLNLSGTVLKVDERSMDAPLIANKTVYLRMRFIVKYRQQLY